jgi:hypothetical protein
VRAFIYVIIGKPPERVKRRGAAILSKPPKYAKLKKIKHAGKRNAFSIKPGKNTKNHQTAPKQNEDRSGSASFE